MPTPSSGFRFVKRWSADQTIAIAAAAIISPSNALEKYSALVCPKG